jgi:hypothetical protein
MNDAYNLGVELALRATGLEKRAGLSPALLDKLRTIATHPTTIGAGLGAAGGLLQGGDERRSLGERVLRSAAAGGLIGTGIKYLPKYIDRVMPKGHALAKDMPWLAPSLVAPAIVAPGGKS